MKKVKMKSAQFDPQMLTKLLENSISFLIQFTTNKDKNEYFLHQVRLICRFLQYFAPYPRFRDHLLLGGGSEDTLTVSNKFTTFPEASQAIKTFCAKNFYPILIANSHRNDSTDANFYYKEFSYACAHFGKRKYSGKGIRTKAKIYHSGCPFIIKLCLSQDPLHYRISFINLKHNHETGPDIYSQYLKHQALSEQQKAFVKEMVMTSNATNKQILRFVHELMNKSISHKAIYNLRSSVMRESSFNNENLEIYVKELFVEKWNELQRQKNSHKIENRNNLVVPTDENVSGEFISSCTESRDHLPFWHKNDQRLTRWTTFRTFPEASQAIKTFCARNYHPVRIVQSHINDPTNVNFYYRDVFYRCVHSVIHKSAGKIRKRKYAYRSGCPFIIKLSITEKIPAQYRIFYLNLNHNHEIGPLLFMQHSQERSLNEEEKSFVKEMMATSDAQNKDIIFFVQEFMNKYVSIRDICNLRCRFKKNLDEIYKQGEQKYVKEMFAKKWKKIQLCENFLPSTSQDDACSFLSSFSIPGVSPNDDLNVRVDSQQTEVSNSNQEIHRDRHLVFSSFRNPDTTDVSTNICNVRSDSEQIENSGNNEENPNHHNLAFSDTNVTGNIVNNMYDSQQIQNTNSKHENQTNNHSPLSFRSNPSLPDVRHNYQQNENTNQQNQADLSANHENVAKELSFCTTKETQLPDKKDGKSLRFLYARRYTDKLAAVLTLLSNKEYKKKFKTLSLLTQAWQQNQNVMLFKEENNVLTLLKENVDPKKSQMKHRVEKNLNPKLSSKKSLIRNTIDGNADKHLMNLSIQNVSKKEQASFLPKVVNVAAEIKATNKKQKISNNSNVHFLQSNLSPVSANETTVNLPCKRVRFFSLIPFSSGMHSVSFNNATQCSLSAKPSNTTEYSKDVACDSRMNTDQLVSNSTDNRVKVTPDILLDKDQDNLTTLLPQSSFTVQPLSKYVACDSRMITDELVSNSSDNGDQITPVVLLDKDQGNLTTLLPQSSFAVKPDKVLKKTKTHTNGDLFKNAEKRIKASTTKQTSDEKGKSVKLLKMLLPKGFSIDKSVLSEHSINIEPVKALNRSAFSMEMSDYSCPSADELVSDSMCRAVHTIPTKNLSLNKSVISLQCNLAGNPVKKLNKTKVYTDVPQDSCMDIDLSASVDQPVAISPESTPDKTLNKHESCFNEDHIKNSSKGKKDFVTKQTFEIKTKSIKVLNIVSRKGLTVDKSPLPEVCSINRPLKSHNLTIKGMDALDDPCIKSDESVNNLLCKAVQSSSVALPSKANECQSLDTNMIPSQCLSTVSPVTTVKQTKICTNVHQDVPIDKDELANDSSIPIDESANDLSLKSEICTDKDISDEVQNSVNSLKILPHIPNKDSSIVLLIPNITNESSSQAQKCTSLINKAINTVLKPKVTTCNQMLSTSKSFLDKNEETLNSDHSGQNSLNTSTVILSSGKLQNSSRILCVPRPSRYNLPLVNSVNKNTEVCISQKQRNTTEENDFIAKCVPLIGSLIKSEPLEIEDPVHISNTTDPTENLLFIKQEDSPESWEGAKSSQLEKINLLLTDIQRNQSDFFSKDEIAEVIKIPLHNKLLDLKNSLTVADIEDIASRNMLNDKIMNIGQVLIKMKFPKTSGLQDVLLGSALKFKAVSSREKFVQIIHCVSFRHWITVSTLNAPAGHVFVYDSIDERIPRDAIPQICKIMNVQLPCLTIISKPMQLQTNSVDCGLFALASAITLLCGKDPSQIVYNVNAMRQHLLSGLVKNNLEEFPTVNIHNAMRSTGITESFPLHCLCRQPLLTDCNFRKLKNYYQCLVCKKFYHNHCKAECCKNMYKS